MKERITVTVDKELLEWIDRKIAERIFANRSHGFTLTVDKELLVWLDSKVSRKVFANRSHGMELLIKNKKENENRKI